MFFNVEDERYHGVQERTHDDCNWQDYLLWEKKKTVMEGFNKQYKKVNKIVNDIYKAS